AGTTVSTTEQATNDYDATLNIKLADETGSSDALTVGLNNATTQDDITLVTTAIETVTLKGAATGINAGTTVDASGVAASSLIITGGVAASGLNLSGAALNKTVTSIDTSGFSGIVNVKASTSAVATGVTVTAGTIITEGVSADTFVGTTATGKTDSFTGNFGATETASDLVTQLSKFENYTMSFTDGVAIAANTNQGFGDGDNVVKSVTLTGGLVSSTYTATDGYIDGANLTSFDASGLGGAISIQVNAGANTGTSSTNGNLGSVLTIKGSSSATTDKVEYLTNGLAVTAASTTGKLLTENVETVVLTTATNASTVDAAGLVGVKTIAVEAAQSVTLKNLAAGTNLQLGAIKTSATDEYTGTLTYSLADATGASDALTVSMLATGSANETNAILVGTGVETLTLASATTSNES
ncbi:hypothetical protein N9O33_08865, partial [Gammaproteobacteria bacterium]|nr:hypothetical protein [Gammaproteobacteria bacterium]